MHHLFYDVDKILQEEEEGVSGVRWAAHFDLQELLIVVHVDEALQLPPAVLGPVMPLVQVHFLLLTLTQHVAPQKHLKGQYGSLQVNIFRGPLPVLTLIKHVVPQKHLTEQDKEFTGVHF